MYMYFNRVPRWTKTVEWVSIFCIEGTASQWEKKIVEYAYDLHVIVYITFLRLSFAFDEVFKEYSVKTMNRVKMAFLNL